MLFHRAHNAILAFENFVIQMSALHSHKMNSLLLHPISAVKEWREIPRRSIKRRVFRPELQTIFWNNVKMRHRRNASPSAVNQLRGRSSTGSPSPSESLRDKRNMFCGDMAHVQFL
jgi:hypothetical protein